MLGALGARSGVSRRRMGRQARWRRRHEQYLRTAGGQNVRAQKQEGKKKREVGRAFDYEGL